MILFYILLIVIFIVYHSYRWIKLEPNPKTMPTKWRPTSDSPMASFLVPVWNGAHDVPNFVSAYNSLSYPSKELILCAGGTDDSLEVAKSYKAKDIIVIEQLAGEGKQKALEKSLLVSSGEIIYLTDIDCVPDDDVVFTLLEPLITNIAKVVTGPSQPLKTQLENQLVCTHWAAEQINQAANLTTTEGILGRNAALWRHILEETKAFTVKAPSGTDYTLAKELIKAGYALHFVPGAPIFSNYPDNILLYSRKQARWVRNVFVLGKRYNVFLEVRSTIITLMLPFVLATVFIIGIFFSKTVLLIGILLVTHALVNKAWYLRKSGQPVTIYGIIQHFVANLIASWRATWQIVTGNIVW